MNAYLSVQDRRQRAHGAVDRLHERLLAHDMAGFADVFAGHGVIEFPFAPPGWPTLRGRDQIREYLMGNVDEIDLTGIVAQTRYETTDPDVLIVEWEVDGTVRATGRPYRMRYINVVKVGPEGIELFRDYWSPLAVGHALGRLDELTAMQEGAA
ncbi:MULTISPECIES: nuclear transport factor 2 family protein [Amycolatopsis]|uniref:Ketosteroid isomerase-related protein n=2 Tax=Amycolatopsis TaxID=1813 RepID=A0A1I3Y806_9PSEU|nr:nuclear transport factor 2 family protein [Amycolatopsis sacchari]SFK27346.1 Ketosteroid isomerase-related protein [Amycolatopsis sacchari]